VISRSQALALVFATFAVGSASAGEVRVSTSDGTPVTVVLDGSVVGQTPLALDVQPGSHNLAFRTAVFAPTAFTFRIDVGDSPLGVQVDWQRQTASAALVPAVAPASAAPPTPSVPTPPPAPPAGEVFVTSSPAGAPIFLDDRATGLTTPSLLRDVPRGKHKIDVQTACERASTEVVVKEALVARVELTLQPGVAAGRFLSDPPGALVLLDGKEVGRTPVTVSQVACGEHEWSIRLQGYLSADGRRLFPAFRPTEISATLQKERFGTLVLIPDPLDTSLSLDGLVLGVGPRTVENVGAGPHAIAGIREGYVTTNIAIDLAPEVVTRVDVVLPPVADATPADPAQAPRSPKPPRTPARAVPHRPEPDATNTPGDATLPPGSARLPVARIAANSVTTAAALAAIGVSIPYWISAQSWYDGYLTIRDPIEAERTYTEELLPRRDTAIALTVVGSALAATSAALWGTTKFRVAPTVGGVVLSGDF
jgi:hypothetical protein